jgi:hypothetical protein
VIFQPEFAELVLAGRKTQTRRRFKSWDSESCRYKVGRTYAVQDGRGRPALGRILILSVAPVRVEDLDGEDAIGEGFGSQAEFWHWWELRYGVRHGWCWRIEFEVAP